jgi:drug/metabolite transporter (DMT)-like permease
VDTTSRSIPEGRNTARALHAYLPYLALVIGVSALGFSAIFVKWANAPGTVTGFYRVAIAALVTAIPFALHARRSVLRSTQHVPRLSPLATRHSLSAIRHLLFAILAGLLFSGDLATWNSAVLLTSAANATLFGNTAPLWVGIGALIFLRERLRAGFWLGLALAVLGAAVILSEDLLTHPTLGLGDLLGLCAGFFYGMFMLATQRARERLPTFAAWWIAAATSAVVLFIVNLVLGQPLVGYAAPTYLNFIGLALVSQVTGWLALNYALGHLRASIVAPTLLGQPVLTALLAVPLLGQSIGWVQVAGGALVLGGIWVVHQTQNVKRKT